ncbi:glycosyltransferase [Ramlibacter monticola]
MIPVSRRGRRGWASFLRSRARSRQREPRPIAPPSAPVDVIVPVYRGLADTRLCVDSVLASPVRTPYRLVVINDASPDPEVTSWLRRRAEQDGRILLLENAENLGFVATVNRGMGLDAQNDVVLLNSDTEVANDWLDRLRDAAYSDARVASVTPLSTNATICSYPRFCQDNPLPQGYTTARLDALCARVNRGVAVDVPTGVGFCMYIRRDALLEVGLFDVEHFGKGYGEENDFCLRADAAGWRNLHLLDTFVLHTGGVSFGAGKASREHAAMQVMRRMHPQYEADVMSFIRDDPALGARLALDLARIAESGLPVILALLHNRSGGTMRHVKDVARLLAGRAVMLTLTPASSRRVLLRLAEDAEGLELAFRLPEQWEGLLDVLRRVGVRHVHFHHLLGHPQALRDLPDLLGVDYDFTVHDFYSYCTHISLTGRDERYAGERGPGQCGCCAPEISGPKGFGTVGQWRAANARLLAGARYVLAPSHDAALRIAGFAPDARMVVVPHPDLAGAGTLPPAGPAPLRGDAPLKIVVLGALSRMKGADVLEATAREAARRGAPLEFHLLGYGYRAFHGCAASLVVHGKYEERDLPGLLASLRPHLAWFPAQCPETYSYTLSSALEAGLPVVVPDLGAFPERVQGRAWSWIRPWDTRPAQWTDEFVALREKYFRPGKPPPLSESRVLGSAGFPTPYADWQYGHEYLAGLQANPQVTAPFTATELVPYLSTHFMTARLRVFAVLDYLRTHRLLQGLAASIPAAWRQRVSDWLSA